ncbi:MAG TPA: SRPBCC domain-containing protein [Acidimicrobiales bacterium]|nr:SRPBCC domain-containing protein [Acidimicrobiales bacterium]
MIKDFEIREEVTLPATPEQVWDAIATSDGLAAWFQPADIGPDSAMVVDWQPSTRLVTEIPGADPETTHRYEFVIDKHGQGARLRFLYTGVERDDWDEEFTARAGRCTWRPYASTSPTSPVDRRRTSRPRGCPLPPSLAPGEHCSTPSGSWSRCSPETTSTSTWHLWRRSTGASTTSALISSGSDPLTP